MQGVKVLLSIHQAMSPPSPENVSSFPKSGHTHHLLILLQQWTGEVQLREGIDRHESEPGWWGTDGLHHSGLHSREGVREAGPVPHRQGNDLKEQEEQSDTECSPSSLN